MKLAEQIQVPYSKELSTLCHLAKDLYNSANWYVRQDFFQLNNTLSYYDLDFILKHIRVLPFTSHKHQGYLFPSIMDCFQRFQQPYQIFSGFKGADKENKGGRQVVSFSHCFDFVLCD